MFFYLALLDYTYDTYEVEGIESDSTKVVGMFSSLEEAYRQGKRAEIVKNFCERGGRVRDDDEDTDDDDDSAPKSAYLMSLFNLDTMSMEQLKNDSDRESYLGEAQYHSNGGAGYRLRVLHLIPGYFVDAEMKSEEDELLAVLNKEATNKKIP